MFPWNLFPLNKKMNQHFGQFNQNEVEKFVKDMLTQMIPSQMQGTMNPQDWSKSTTNQGSGSQESTGNSHTDIPRSVFETHDYVFVRIKIKEESWLSQMKLFHTSNQLIIEKIPELENKLTITLPAIVKKKGAHSIYKEGILEIRIPKNIDMQFTEIDVSEKY